MSSRKVPQWNIQLALVAPAIYKQSNEMLLVPKQGASETEDVQEMPQSHDEEISARKSSCGSQGGREGRVDKSMTPFLKIPVKVAERIWRNIPYPKWHAEPVVLEWLTEADWDKFEKDIDDAFDPVVDPTTDK